MYIRVFGKIESLKNCQKKFIRIPKHHDENAYILLMYANVFMITGPSIWYIHSNKNESTQNAHKLTKSALMHVKY